MKNHNPHTSLRIAFWTLITTCSLFWILAILLLSACSGSIFSSGKSDSKSGTSNGNGNPNVAVVGQVQPDTNGFREDSDTANKPTVHNWDTGETANTVEQKNGPGFIEDTNNRSVTVVENLNLYPLLFPKRTQGKSKNALDQLAMTFEIQKSTPEENAQRTVKIRLLENSSPVGSKVKWVEISSRSLSLVVKSDEVSRSTGERFFSATGYLNKDDNQLNFHLHLDTDARILQAHIVQIHPDNSNKTFPLETSRHFKVVLD